MGEIRARVTLENSSDREVVYRGHGAEADVRRTTVEGIVDTGAVSPDSRGVRLYSPGGGGAATIEVEGTDAEWCREVLDTVLNLLRPHAVWYGTVYRGGLWAPIWAVLVLGGAVIAASWFLPRWVPVVLALYLPLLAGVVLRERLFPAADIRVRGRGAQPDGIDGS